MAKKIEHQSTEELNASKKNI